MRMNWAISNTETLVISATLTLLAALITVVFSVFFGATLAFHARPTLRYGATLALLFIPFAVGSSVWAYSVTRLVSWSGMQGDLVTADTWYRATALLSLCIGRTLPLGIFFCATTLQRYTSEIRPYLQTHHIGLPFFQLCALNRMPKSILMLLGLFGGALMASEAALPTFLYRANPGTQPETANIMLARLFREMYASAGPESLTQVATLGLLVSLVLLASAFLGTLIGVGMLRLAHTWMGRCQSFTSRSAAAFAVLLRVGSALSLLPGIFCLIGLFAPTTLVETSHAEILEQAFSYWEIVALGLLVGGAITAVGIALAVRLRYGQKDLLTWVENNYLASCVLLLPAFVPILSVVAVLGNLSHGQMTGLAGYMSLFVSHFGLHYSVFQFICMSLIAVIPERHVSWQRAMRIRYSFSLMTDGFKRHFAVIVGLVCLGTVQVVTDGSVARWFYHLVKAPEEALYAAIFGRLSNANEAVMIAWSVGLVATSVCAVLAAAYVRELKSRPRYV
jgi:hypothetical protein